MPPLSEKLARRRRIMEALQGRSLEQAVADPALRADLEAEAASGDPDRLVTRDHLRVVEEARIVRRRQPHLGLFFSTDDVIIVPGFMGSELVDAAGGYGLVWVDPRIIFNADELLTLQLNPYTPGGWDSDATAGVAIRPNGGIPLLYGALKYDLEVRRYDAQVFGFDWRKNLDEAAGALADVIRDRGNRRFRPLHLIAHSQGSLVARRALQMVGPDLGRRLVSNLVLLGPATAGTFSAAFALAGTHSMLTSVQRYGIEPPAGFTDVLQSMSGLYQLLPWRTGPADGGIDDAAIRWVRENQAAMREPPFWESGVDETRLAELYEWGRRIDATFINDRTTIILGDQPTAGGARFVGGKLVEDPDYTTRGDGTVPDGLALVGGVTRVYRAVGGEHMMLPATRAVIAAVRDVLAGRPPRVDRAFGAGAADGIPTLQDPPAEVEIPPKARALPAGTKAAPGKKAAAAEAVPEALSPGRQWIADVSPPPNRLLRVFSFDPLLAGDLDALGIEQMTVSLPWDFADGDQLRPGPIGEYLEVVDYDPASQSFYPPVDLNHPHVLAQDGLPPSEGDPRFHQQMVYAVAMNTIRHFEVALGRVALWAPNLRRRDGEVVSLEDEFVRRLRVYPHALRQANAFYHPDRKALLFGYFPAQGADVGRNLPGGTVFTCLSHDVVAHETTHALLDGLHRYFTDPSNPDVFAFHEAFADIVALFQHFGHADVLRHQLTRTRGDVRRESTLGVLARQFGVALGHRGALRQYLGQKDEQGVWRPVEPDPTLIGKVFEPHARGALLVAALFRAFTNIYENRVKDLQRIATGGTGVLPHGDLHPDLVNRLAEEAAKSARHLLNMCIRALDYVPPVDITFGEYLRALITADYELIKDDDRRYRVAVIAAFRDWGIYPGSVRSLSVDSLLWRPPHPAGLRNVHPFLKGRGFDEWDLTVDRRKVYADMRRLNREFHGWLDQTARPSAGYLGLALEANAPASIARRDGAPRFEVHSFRPCRRIGPDGQQRTDLVAEIVQRRKAFLDPARQEELEAGRVSYDAAGEPDFYYRGGCTLLIDPETGDIRYCVTKAIRSDTRLERARRYRQGDLGDGAGGAFLSDRDDDRNPFGFLHASH